MIKSHGPQGRANSHNQNHYKKRPPQHNRRRDFNGAPNVSNANNSSNNNSNNNSHSNNSNINDHSSASNQQKQSSTVINSIADFQRAVINASLDYPLPQLTKDTQETQIITDLPKVAERKPALLSKTAKLLGITYKDTLAGNCVTILDDEIGQNITKSDVVDPIAEIVLNKRSHSKQMKLGSILVDIYKKPAVPNTKIVNKFLQKDSLSTPFKRIRDEVVDASSSLKKNKRMNEIQHGTPNQSDTTMELSFEGKAMNKNEFVKLVDDSDVQDDSIIPEFDTTVSRVNNASNFNFDTRNLLQNTEFNFEFRATQ